VPLICFHLRTETEPVSETSCVVLLPFVYSGCVMFIVVTSVLMRCWFGFLLLRMVCNLCVCVQVCCFMVGFLVFLGGGLVHGLIIFGLLDTRRWIKSKNTLRLTVLK